MTIAEYNEYHRKLSELDGAGEVAELTIALLEYLERLDNEGLVSDDGTARHI